MTCHVCGYEAVGRCYTCGQLFCAEHGKVDCVRCATGIAEGDTRTDHISTSPLAPTRASAWWRPKEAEEYQPPACYQCKGLTRSRCRTCGQYYCRDHGRRSGVCQSCHESSMASIFVLALIMAVLGGLLAVSYFMR